MNVVHLRLAAQHPKQILLTETEYDRLAGTKAILTVSTPMPLQEVKTAYIRAVLKHCHGNKVKAAKLLQITRQMLYQYVEK